MTLPERTNSTPKSSACRGKYQYVAVDEDVDEDVAVAVAVAVDVAVAVARGGRLTLEPTANNNCNTYYKSVPNALQYIAPRFTLQYKATNFAVPYKAVHQKLKLS